MAMITLIASYSLFNECAQHAFSEHAGVLSRRIMGLAMSIVTDYFDEGEGMFYNGM